MLQGRNRTICWWRTTFVKPVDMLLHFQQGMHLGGDAAQFAFGLSRTSLVRPPPSQEAGFHPQSTSWNLFAWLKPRRNAVSWLRLKEFDESLHNHLKSIFPIARSTKKSILQCNHTICQITTLNLIYHASSIQSGSPYYGSSLEEAIGLHACQALHACTLVPLDITDKAKLD